MAHKEGVEPRDSVSPEERLDDKLKAMVEALERRSGASVLPDLSSLPKARPLQPRS